MSPTATDLIPTLRSALPDVDESVIRDYVQRMDPEYFAQFSPGDITRHVGAAATLSPDHPCAVEIVDEGAALATVIVIAYDYFSEFAMICGVLASFGLDIRDGTIYTSAGEQPLTARRTAGPRPRRRPGASRKIIVDVFRVRPTPGRRFEREGVRRELEAVVRLLDAQRFDEARRRVNRRLIETFGRTKSATRGLLHPVSIHFDNQVSPDDTVMDIRSTDTPAFLYAFANALAMRGLYIRQATFQNVGSEVHDRFYVRSRHGGKIEDDGEQQALRLTAALIKQFTHFLTWAPDPTKAIQSFDRFLDVLLERARTDHSLAALQDKKTLAILARLLGTSDFLWEEFLRRQHANLLPLLEQYQDAPLLRPHAEMQRELRKKLASARSDEAKRKALNQFKDQELFRIDMAHLLAKDSGLPEFSSALTELAELIVSETVRECELKLSHELGRPKLKNGKPCPFTVFGMGKFGGRELGYASDIEVLFVYGGAGRTDGRRPLDNSEYFERLVQEVLRWIEAKQEGIFHVDVRLRPHGGKGLLANAVDEIKSYYRPGGLAAPFERQALIKLRPVAGDDALGQMVVAYRDAFVYGKQPWNLAEALDLRRQQIRELTDPDSVNVKYSPGGLIDVEYSVQYLQLMHGSKHAAVRTPNTLAAIQALAGAKVVSPDEGRALREAYLFFRLLIDGLRIVRGHAKDLVLPSAQSEAFVFLARRVGYTSESWDEGARKLAEDIERHMRWTRRFYEGRFGAP